MKIRELLSSILLSAVLAATVGCGGPGRKTADLARYVDPMIGTNGHGHTYPGPLVPFGMVQLSPDVKTTGWDWCSGYHYSSPTIMGFSHTHLSGTGCADYGDILFMPTTGKVSTEPGPESTPGAGYRSAFSHANERAETGYYRVKLDTYGVVAELTATARCGMHRYIFPRSNESNIIIDIEHGIDNVCTGGRIEITGNASVVGMRRSKGWAADRFIYFAAEFSKPFHAFGTSSDGVLSPGARKAEGKRLKAFLTFPTGQGEAVLVRVGISAVSIEGAKKNLEAEMPDFDFGKYRKAARKAWDRELNRVRVEGGTEAEMRTFYTALYHVMSVPNVFQDADGDYFGMDRMVHKAEGFTNHTVFSLWDTFRAEHPLLALIDPDRAVDLVRSLVQAYKEAGRLPVWTLWGNETDCMIGYHSAPVIFDAWMKGLRGFDMTAAYEAMKHSAELDREGLGYYRRLGYIPADRDEGPVSKTLEYAYDDWCIAQTARALGKDGDYREFNQRSLFYKNVFDASTGFMRGRMSDGRWIEPFDPFAVSGIYTEANAWQYSFSVLHDPAGLIRLYGGPDKFADKLDALFSAPNDITGRDQPDVTGLIGQNAHGNEPSHHVSYFYDHAGRPWKAQEMVREIMERFYSDRTDGLCGNEDCGQMSAWYVFSAMGFYPVTPGQNTYAIGSPSFKRTVISLHDGRQFIIEAPNASAKARYIRSAMLNGRPFDRVWLTHEEITKGGVLTFEMSAEPNADWGKDNSGLFAMAPDADMVPAPRLETTGEVFYDKTEASLSCPAPGTVIRYTIDGSEPGPGSPMYLRPITFEKEGVLRAAAFVGQERSLTVTAGFVKSKFPPAVYSRPFSAHYNGGGPMALTDGRLGSEDYGCGRWQGFEGDDLEAVIDLVSPRKIGRVSLGFLRAQKVWVFFPELVEFSVSDDGITFGKPVEVRNGADTREESAAVKRFGTDLGGARARYLRVRAKNIGTCPAWHRGAGGKAWIFADEVTID